MRGISLIGALALLTACDPVAPPKPVATALPAQVCKEAQAAVAEATKSSAIVLSTPLEATMAHESWLPMPEAQRDGLTRAIGIAATCAEGTPKLEQEVVIRSETGMILTRRVVATSFSMPGQ